MLRLTAFLFSAFLPVLSLNATAATDDDGAKGGDSQAVDFVRDIQPIFRDRCWECHGADKSKGQLRLHRREEVFTEDPGGFATIVPGDVEDSLLFEMITLDADDPDVMPAEGDRLSDAQVDLIRRWIEQGAVWPDGVDPEAKPEHDDGMQPRDLSLTEAKSEGDAIAAIGEIGGLALRVAENTNVVDVNLSLLGEKITDKELQLLAGLEPTLVWLNLSRTAISDDGLRKLTTFPEIRRLNLSNTPITDAGLATVAGLGHVEYLNLYGTEITDEGLKHLAGMKSLRKLYLWRTKSTADGAAELAKALPETRIDRGDYVLADPIEEGEDAEGEGTTDAAADATAGSPVNDTCPITGKALAADQFVVHEGVSIGFCCADCVAKFKANPAGCIDKVTGFAEAKAKLIATETAEDQESAKAPVNAKCPVSGADVDPAFTSDYEGESIAFCCAKCKAKFDADPKKFADKIADK